MGAMCLSREILVDGGFGLVEIAESVQSPAGSNVAVHHDQLNFTPDVYALVRWLGRLNLALRLHYLDDALWQFIPRFGLAFRLHARAMAQTFRRKVIF